MVRIVSNTSPLNYLILIEAAGILEALYREVWIPLAVENELSDPAAPAQVRRFVATPPHWLQVKRTVASELAGLSHLDPGVVEAILLAREVKAEALMIDDRDGARAARKLGLRVIGTLGVLDRAAQLGIIDIVVALDRLQQTSFRSPKAVISKLLSRHRESGQ